MTLRSLILADNSTFLNSDDFGEPIVHWIGGNDRHVETFTAVVEWDTEDRLSNNHDGDSDRLSTERGRRIRRVADLEIPASVAVTLGSPDESSKFIVGNAISGTLLTAVRVIGRDHATQTVRCVVVEHQLSKRTTVRR